MTGAVYGISRYKAGTLSRRRLGLFLIFMTSADILLAQCYIRSGNRALWHFYGGCAAALLLYWLSDLKKYRRQINSLLIIMLGACLKLYYLLITSVYVRQHDVNSFGGEDGHAGYIEYLLTHRRLPGFDVRERWQFCHPPLHHGISAAWIYVNESCFGVGYDQARESLQTLSLFWSLCIVISAYRLLRHFELKGKALYIPLVIISFHPSLILFSGSINNDPLAAAFVTGGLAEALKWQRDRRLGSIIKLALCIGLGMMTKLSAALIAPPVALVFLLTFIRHFKAEGRRLFCQFVIFAAVCLPLGLWFGVRNYLRWEVPFTYVQEMDKSELQYLGEMSFKERVTDTSLRRFSSPYEQWAERDEEGNITGYNEYDPLAALLKNSLFGEFINEKSFKEGSYVNKLAALLFFTNICLAAEALLAMLLTCVKKPSADKLFLALTWLMMVASFYKMAADYPFTCTMNFRYITPTALIGSCFLGLALKEQKPRPAGKFLTALLAAEAGVFAFCAGGVYTGLVG